MKRLVCVVLRLTLIFLVVCGRVCAAEGGESSAKPSASLSQAADEFKVLTRDLGMRPESPPNTQERHGPKMRWHGRVYENFRNDVLDAIPHQVKQNGESVSPLRRNQFGFNVSGPLLVPHFLTNPNNTFFMLSFEGVRERIFRANLLTVPTQQQRLGDFSQTVDPSGNILPIYDPAETGPNPTYDPTQAVSTSNLQYLRAQFPGNIIPTSCLSPRSLQALTLYPAANTDVGPFFQNNYFVNSPQIDDADGIIAKLDHPFRDRHRVTSNTTVSSGYLSPARYFPNDASPTSPDQHFSTLRSELDYVYTANSSTVNSASLAVNSDVVQSGDVAATPFPNYALGNYVAMGTAFPISRNARTTVGLTDAWSTKRGKHSLHLTGDASFYQVNSYDPTYPSGYYQFSADITSLPGIVDTGDPFAGFLLGQAASAASTVTTAPSYFRDSYQDFSVQDRYAARKDLTLTATVTAAAGLRGRRSTTAKARWTRS